MRAGDRRWGKRTNGHPCACTAWAAGPLAGEWIHQAVLAVKTETPIEVLRDTVAQFPTFSESYLNAVEDLEL